MTYISINETLIPAEISGRIRDDSWDSRSSKTIKLLMTYQEALNTFIDDISWSIVETYTREEVEVDDLGEEHIITVEDKIIYDNSDYSIAGDIIDHRDGYVSVKMGKPTAEELLALIEEAL